MSSHIVYIVECADKSLYTGWTNDLEKRIHSHNHAKIGAKYTRGRRPVKLVYSEVVPNLTHALQREAQIKRLSRSAKKALVRQNPFGG